MNGFDYSLNALMEYCQSLKDSVDESKSKAKATGRLTACRVVLRDLLPEEIEDVRKINVDVAATKYGARANAKRKTIAEYRNRVKSVITAFVENAPSSKAASSDDTNASSSTVNKDLTEPTSSNTKRYYKSAAPAVNTINVQIRSDFLAQLILPLDLKVSEAEHLCNLIKALPWNQGE